MRYNGCFTNWLHRYQYIHANTLICMYMEWISNLFNYLYIRYVRIILRPYERIECQSADMFQLIYVFLNIQLQLLIPMNIEYWYDVNVTVWAHRINLPSISFTCASSVWSFEMLISNISGIVYVWASFHPHQQFLTHDKTIRGRPRRLSVKIHNPAMSPCRWRQQATFRAEFVVSVLLEPFQR